MGRPRQRRLDPRSIAALDVKTAVVGQVRPDPGGIGLQRGQRVGHRVAPLIVGDDRVGGILGGIPRLGQHHGHRVADILHQVLGQRTHLGDAHLAPVGAGMAQPWLDRPDSVLGLLRAGQNRHHARHRPGLRHVKRHQPRRRNRRSQDHHFQPAGMSPVARIGSLARHKARILYAQLRSPDFPHAQPPPNSSTAVNGPP